MSTYVRREHTVETQKVVRFSGEGAYQGSTKDKPDLPPSCLEETPTTLELYEREGRTEVEEFDVTFPNEFVLAEQLPEPTQEEVRTDGVTFCWTPYEEALTVAGPLTRRVLTAMRPYITGWKRNVYVDSKIQYFEPGDLPVDSQLWHVDGVTNKRKERAARFGWRSVHDLRARFDTGVAPFYLAYQSSTHCATRFVRGPLRVRVPELIPSFDVLDAAVRAARPREFVQPAGSIISFDGQQLHEAVPAEEAGWRLWVRLTETDREIRVDPAMLDCYGTVFRTR